MGVVESSLYHNMSDTASFGVVSVILHGIDSFPPATPVSSPMISIFKNEKHNKLN